MKLSIDCFAAAPERSTKHSSYFPVYDAVLGPWVGRDVTFVEVGVKDGGSLFMWRDFFGPKARIIGVDLNPEAKRWRREGFEIHIGSQTDPHFWRRFFAQVGRIDVLLDDGGHLFDQQITTVRCAAPFVADGGLIVVEDVHTSYLPQFGGPNPLSFVNWAKNVVDGVNHRSGTIQGARAEETTIHGVRFYESIVVFEIDRRLAVRSRPVANRQGENLAVDYRDQDASSLSAQALMRAFRY